MVHSFGLWFCSECMSGFLWEVGRHGHYHISRPLSAYLFGLFGGGRAVQSLPHFTILLDFMSDFPWGGFQGVRSVPYLTVLAHLHVWVVYFGASSWLCITSFGNWNNNNLSLVNLCAHRRARCDLGGGIQHVADSFCHQI